MRPFDQVSLRSPSSRRLPTALLAFPLAIALAASPARATSAEERPPLVLVRPQLGAGYASAFGRGHDGGPAEHAGLRVLLAANPSQRYGLEATFLRSRIDGVVRSYVATGVVLEQLEFGWLSMAIGTIGYVPVNGGGPCPFGVVSGLGWERRLTRTVQLFAVYRYELVFRQPVVGISSASVGVAFGL